MPHKFLESPGRAGDSRLRSGLVLARRVETLTGGLAGEAVWWDAGRIREVGGRADLDARVPRGVPRFELPGATVTPGFVDGHTHFLMWGLGRRRVRLAGAASRQEALARVAAAAPVQGWVLGQGWDANRWTEAPDRWSLDAVRQGPVCLDSLDVHAAWLNSAALARAGIHRSTQDPAGGRIVRDATGEPTGVLLERAVDLVRPHLPVPGPEESLEAVREAQREAHRLGITGIHDVEGPEALAAFRALEREDGLRLRVLFHPPVERLGELVARGARSGAGSHWLGLGGVKLFLDGSLGSRTAWMLEPYEGGSPGDRGMPVTDRAVVREAMWLAAGAGLAVTAHAIGDAAVRRALELMEPLPRAALPHRIEHLQCVAEADLARAAAAGIVASMQPAHLLTDIPLVERHWGRRGRGAYAFRSLLARGTSVTFGSDVPVASLDPRIGIYAALERRMDAAGSGDRWRGEERVEWLTALRAYTLAGAEAAGAGRRRGRLAPGQDADLVAWEVDPAIDRDQGEAFRRARVRLTVVGGEVVLREPR